MDGKTMPVNLRFTQQEQEDLRKKAIEINKILVGKGIQPLKDSELAHEILAKSIRYAKLNERGEIYIDQP